jgi:hypothetical protein
MEGIVVAKKKKKKKRQFHYDEIIKADDGSRLYSAKALAKEYGCFPVQITARAKKLNISPDWIASVRIGHMRTCNVYYWDFKSFKLEKEAREINYKTHKNRKGKCVVCQTDKDGMLLYTCREIIMRKALV